MISVDEALEIVLSQSQKLPPVTVTLQDALGKILAEDIHAPDPLPPYPASFKVYPTPSIAVLSTGDELVEPTVGCLTRGQIWDSNHTMVLAAASQQQCKVFDLGIARDDKAEIERALESAVSSGVDLIITSGGVSMGDRDYVKPLLQKRGKIYFDKVRMKPRKPLTFAEIVHGPTDNMRSNRVLAFGLPGNPVSALVCFNLFVIPAIRRLSGWANPHLPRLLKDSTCLS